MQFHSAILTWKVQFDSSTIRTVSAIRVFTLLIKKTKLDTGDSLYDDTHCPVYR